MEKQEMPINFFNVSFQYEGQAAESLRHIGVTVRKGEFVVLTGPSGCGKTTITRCINSLIPHFFEGELSGSVTVMGRDIRATSAGEAGKSIASIFQDPRSQFFTTNSSSEVAFACQNYGVPHDEIIRHVADAFSEMAMEDLQNRNIFTLSSGERQKVAFVAATTLKPQIYVLDEPSANLDIHTILRMREILSTLKAQGHTIIVSEHRLFYLRGLADRFLRIEDGRIAEELTDAQMSALTLDELQNRKLRPLDLSCVTVGPKEPIGCANYGVLLFRVENLNFSHKAMPELLQGISFSARAGETVAFVGDNGCGKTTLGKIMAGLIRCREGAFWINGAAVKQRKLSDFVYFVMQEADHQLYTDSVVAELRLGNGKKGNIDSEINCALHTLHLDDFRDSHPYALSGGQKQRVTIGAAMVSDKPIIVLDEPTSGLDWENMSAVARAVNHMRTAGKLVFIITHDLEFLGLTATRAVLLENGAIAADIPVQTTNDLRKINRFMTHGSAERRGIAYETASTCAV